MGYHGYRDDEPITCAICGEMVGAGSHYFRFEGYDYCSEECVQEEIESSYPDATEEELEEIYSKSVEEPYLETAYDKYMNCADEEYDRIRDERLAGD